MVLMVIIIEIIHRKDKAVKDKLKMNVVIYFEKLYFLKRVSS